MSKVAVVFGGPSPEHDVSVLTGLQAVREVAKRHDATALYWSKTNEWFRVSPSLEASDFANGVPGKAEKLEFVVNSDGGFRTGGGGPFAKPKTYRPDVVLIACHGGPGETGQLQGALDLAGIAYTGPGCTSAALGMDKYAFGAAMANAGLPALPRVLLDDHVNFVDFEAPYIVKPRFGGSSIGIEIVDSIDTAKALAKSSPHLRLGAVIEPYRADAVDLNVAVRMFPSLDMSAIEKPLRTSSTSNTILGYADKYVGGEGMVSAPRELPANLDELTSQTVHTLAGAVANLFGVRGVQRIDFLLSGNEVFVNEINTIPGSLSKHLFAESGIDFAELLDSMIQEAFKVPTYVMSSAGADGTALRSAGTIAGKLA